ncbi:MAG: hypothetical protein DI538_26440 [Azospira oryzae]|nr:MAG: hypothetical protein DI538_26440 [Azospira oryzae]
MIFPVGLKQMILIAGAPPQGIEYIHVKIRNPFNSIKDIKMSYEVGHDAPMMFLPEGLRVSKRVILI